ncbi:MAG: hypothetical protein WAN43_14610 [Rhodomicrobium sp.]
MIAQEGADNIGDDAGQVGAQERDVAAQIRHLFLHIQENGLVFGDFSQDMPRHEFLALGVFFEKRDAPFQIRDVVFHVHDALPPFRLAIASAFAAIPSLC